MSSSSASPLLWIRSTDLALAFLFDSVPIPLRRPPSLIRAPLSLLHPPVLQSDARGLTRQRRQRRNGLFRSHVDDGPVPEPWPKRLPHHAALLRARVHQVPAYG